MEVYEVIIKQLVFHLGLGILVGAMGSVGMTWFKSIFKTENRITNALVTIVVVYLFAYILMRVYTQQSIQEWLIVGLYANIGAKGLYESISKLISEPPFKGATGFSYSEYKEVEEKK